MTPNRVIVITGGIASGKSTLCEYLKNKGYIVISADDKTSEIYDIIEVKDSIVSSFGDRVLDGGEVNRSVLRSILLSNPSSVQILNSITHPIIAKRLANDIKRYSGETIFLELPVYFESKVIIDKYIDVDYVVYVYTDSVTRIKRLMQRSNLSYDDATKFIELQLPDEAKIKKSNFIIDNSSNKAALEQKAEELLKNLNL